MSPKVTQIKINNFLVSVSNSVYIIHFESLKPALIKHEILKNYQYFIMNK